MHDAPQQQRDADEDREHEIVEGDIALQVERGDAEGDGQPLDLEQAVLAAGDAVRLDGDEPEHLPEGDGHQRVVDAAPVRDEERDQHAAESRRQHGDREADPEIRHEVELRQPEGIGADAEERAVPERGQAGMAEHEIEGQRIDGEDEDLDAQVLVEPDTLDPQRHRCKQQPARQHGRGEGRHGAACRHLKPPGRSSCRTARVRGT